MLDLPICLRCNGKGIEKIPRFQEGPIEVECRYCGGAGVGPVSIYKICKVLRDLDKRLENMEAAIASRGANG